MSDVLLSFGAQNITGDASKMLKDLQSAFSKADAVQVNVGLKVDDKALNVFKGQLTKILNGLTLSNGAPVKLRIEGVGELESGVESVKKKMDTAASSAERLKKSLGKMSNSDIKSSVKKLSTEYVKIQENIGKFSNLTSWDNRDAKGELDNYRKQGEAVNALANDIKTGIVTQDEYIDRLSKIKREAAQAYKALMEYDAAYKQIQKDAAKPEIGEMSETEIKSKYKSLGDKIAKLEVNSQKYSSANDYTEESKADLKAYNAEIERLKNLQDSLKGKKILSNDFAKEVAEITANLSALDGKLKVFATSADPTKTMVAGTKEYAAALKSVDVEITKTRKNLQEWTAAKNGPASEHYKTLETNLSALEKLYDDVFTGKITKGQFDEAFKGFVSGSDAARKSIKDLGRDTLSAGGKVKEMFGKFSSWFGISQAVMLAVASVKQMVATVIELDSAMTELKKVTDETDATYERFLNKAGSRAKNIGASLTDVVTATADFARLGYDLEEASQLADTAIVYKNVADGIKDIGDASSSIISTVKAFGLEAKDAMSIVDKFNEVSNNFAISSEGIGIAVQKSGAAMKAAGNDIDQTIALATAANTIVQNPEVVGTTLKTLSMYLRASKTEAQAAGEDVEGMAGSVSELRDELLKLTGGTVDIQIDEDTFKSTYQIMKELSEVWGSLTDISKANILEMVGGRLLPRRTAMCA